MPIYEYLCSICNVMQERLEFGDEIDKPHLCPNCGRDMKRTLPTKMTFKLVYDPKRHKFDWDGNRTRRFDEVDKLRKQGVDAEPAKIGD